MRHNLVALIPLLLIVGLYGCHYFQPSKVPEGQVVALAAPLVGEVAPDIEGDDLNGVPLKLSAYRGKVVVVDFWGNW